jgi:heme-degrading monooxygenase HmoA
MHARSAVLTVQSDKLDETARKFEDEQIPKYREQPGYKGFVLLLDREGGRALGVSFWESEDACRASDELGAGARAAIAESGGGSEQNRDYWEVAIDDEV